MDISNVVINKCIVECLTNKNLYKLVRSNFIGLRKFANSHPDLVVFSGILNYINEVEFSDFNSLDLIAKLRNLQISEGTLNELLDNVDYLRSVNADKPISPQTTVLLKNLFYSGHFESVKNKTTEEQFEYCKTVSWVADVIDPRFKIEDISSAFDIDEVSALLSPTSSIKSSMKFINESSPNNGLFPNELVTVSAAPGTGKTQYLFTEALNFTKQGKKVLYIAIGDMVNYFITIRLLCMYYRISPREVYMDLKSYLSKFREEKDLADRFKFVCLDSGKITASEVFNFLSLMKDSYDVWMVDYDGNFAPESDNLYREGGVSYDLAINVCRNYNKLGFIASQPKIQYWTNEALGKECLAESSRKQQITDTIVTFGIRTDSANRCGYAQLVKRRNGSLAHKIPWAAADSGQIIQIDPDMYGELIASTEETKLLVNEFGTLDMPDKYLES